jgi:hypothetical protein
VATGEADVVLGVGELVAGLGAAGTVETAVFTPALDASAAATVVPLVAAQPAVRTRRAANIPTYRPKPRLAPCFPAEEDFAGPEIGSGAEDMIMISDIKAT